MEARKLDQAKELLENFDAIDEAVQEKILTGVKSLAFLYNAVKKPHEDSEEPLAAQPA